MLAREKRALREEVGALRQETAKLCKDKVVLENTLEAEEECMTNRLHKVIEELMHQNLALERRLTAAGSRSRSGSEAGVSSASEDDATADAETSPRQQHPQ